MSWALRVNSYRSSAGLPSLTIRQFDDPGTVWLKAKISSVTEIVGSSVDGMDDNRSKVQAVLSH